LEPSISLALLVLVIALVIIRPRGLNVAWPAVAGGTAALALGMVHWDALRTIFADTWDATLTLIALFVLSEALESNRFFDWAAFRLAQRAGGSGWRLYFFTLLLVCATTALLANDGAVLILTPLFVSLLPKIYPGSKKDWLPYLLALGFFADVMSGFLIPSNLTNIMIADAFKLKFADAALHMLLPSLAALVVGGLFYAARFQREIASPYDPARLSVKQNQVKDAFVFKISWVALALLLAGYLIGGVFLAPVSLVAMPIAIFMLGITHVRRLRRAPDILRAAPWSILLYAIGMFVVVTAAFNTHSLDFMVHVLQGLVGHSNSLVSIAGTGGFLGLTAGAVNNLPATLFGLLSFRSVANISEPHLYAALLGLNIGAKITPYGSLATLLWLNIMARKGIRISWKTYLKETAPVAILALLAALLALFLTS
jgi:arsenical pump membrane protein